MLVSILLLHAAVLALTWLTYWIVFYSPHPRQNDEMHLPTGEQYDERAGQMRALINDLMAVPCQSVSITSRDGLRLCARYYPGRICNDLAVLSSEHRNELTSPAEKFLFFHLTFMPR